MRRGVFVTGTGTGVGKTMVSAAILRAWRNAGVNAAPMKPIQTGCEMRNGRLCAPDLDFALHVGGVAASPDQRALMTPCLYEPACSPHLAGRLAGKYPDMAEICRCADELLKSFDALVVEGAGGVMVPIDESSTMRDLMLALGMPVLIVALPGLGTINHTLMTIESLRIAGATIEGVVICETVPGEADAITADNPRAIELFGSTRILGKIAWNAKLLSADPAAWEEAAKGLDSRILHV